MTTESAINEVLSAMKNKTHGHKIKLPANSEGFGGFIRNNEDGEFMFYPQSSSYRMFECSDDFLEQSIIRSLASFNNDLNKFFYHHEFPIS